MIDTRNVSEYLPAGGRRGRMLALVGIAIVVAIFAS